MSVNSVLEITNDQVYVEWNIKNILILRNEDVCKIDSPCFSLFNRKLYLRIYQNQENNKIYPYLVQNCEAHTSVVFTIGIKKIDGSVYRSFHSSYEFHYCGEQHIYEEDDPIFVDHLDITDALLPDGSLTIFCSATAVDILPYEDSDSSTAEEICTLSKNLTALLRSGRHTDVTIKVQSREFQAHKTILAACSTVFDSMFELDMTEKESGIVNIDDCDPDVFHAFMEYLYSGDKVYVTSENAVRLYKIADKYNVKDLKDLCADFTKCNISVDTFCDAITIATVHDESELLNAATDFFLKNLATILPSPKWLTFLTENPETANELFIKATSRKLIEKHYYFN